MLLPVARSIGLVASNDPDPAPGRMRMNAAERRADRARARPLGRIVQLGAATLLAAVLVAGCTSRTAVDADPLPTTFSRTPVTTPPPSGAPSTPDAPPRGSGTPPGWWRPAPATSWWWQIESTSTIEAGRAEVYDVDLFEAGEQGLVADLQAAGHDVVCYFSAGTWEEFRPDADQFPTTTRLTDTALPDFPDEVWLAIGDDRARPAIEAVISRRLDLAVAQGCDGVEPDNVDGWANDETGGAITAGDQLDYNRWLADQAHRRGLAVGLKNDLGQVAALVDDFDFAVNEQCFAYDECQVYVDTFLADDKPVFNQEYGSAGADGSLSRESFLDDACPRFRSDGISGLWTDSLALDGRDVETCPT